MASGQTLTRFDGALKQHYTNDRVEDMVYRDNPLFALMPKYERFGGRNLPVPIIYGNPQGRSKTFSNALSRSTETYSRVTDFLLTRAKDYSIATIDGETMEATENDADAFVQAATLEVDGAINALTRSLAINMYTDSSCYLGQVNAEPSENSGTFIITLKDAEDITNFEVGMMLVAYAAKTGGSAKHSDGTDDEWEIAAVDRSAGTITLTGDYDSSGNIAADDYLFVEGDRGNGMAGLEAWVPATAPDNTAFFGVDRSVDVTRLGGLRLTGTGGPIEEVLTEADSKVCREGGRLSHYFMSHKKFGDLKNSLGSKVQYVDMHANARISFTGILVEGSKGQIRCVPDQNCPDSVIWGLDMRTWKFYTLNKAVRILGKDGLKWLRQASDDGYEVRVGHYGNLGCRAPGFNIRIAV